MTQHEYRNALLSFAKKQREHRPIDNPEDLIEEDWHRRIIGGSLITWLDERQPKVLAERHTLRVLEFDPKPIVIFETTPPGVAAAQDIVGESREDFVCLLRAESEHWEKNRGDDGFKFHIRYWSYFDYPSPNCLKKLAKAYPAPVDQLRLHRTGDMWGPNCGVFADHLWQWTGREMKLLLEAYSKGIY